MTSVPARIESWLRERPVVPDTGLAIVLGLVGAGLASSVLDDISSGRTVLTLAALFVLHVSVAFRRRASVAAFALASLAMLVLTFAPVLNDPNGTSYPPLMLPNSLVYLVPLYSIAAHGSRLLSRAGLAVGLCGCVLVTIRLWSPQVWGGPSGPGVIAWRVGLVVLLMVSVATVWSLGRLSRVRAQRLVEDRERERQLAARQERDRIGREMHDVVSHALAVMVSQAEGGRMRYAGTPAAQVFSTIAVTGRDAVADMRGLLRVLGGDGSGRRPAPTLADVDELVDRVRAAGTPVDLEVRGRARPMRAAAELAAYRVLQKALTNVVKHAAGEPVRILLDWRDHVFTVHVANRLPATAGGSANTGTGIGMDGMRARVQAVGGTVETGPADGDYLVEAAIPIVERR